MDSAEAKNCFMKLLVIFYSPFKPRAGQVAELLFPREWWLLKKKQARVSVRALESLGFVLHPKCPASSGGRRNTM
jgi:hypothetical protein